MIGIPSILNTKRDVLNLQEMARENYIDRREWLERLKDLRADDIFPIPILEEFEIYFTIPKVERPLPTEYEGKFEIVSEDLENGMKKEYIKINAKAPTCGYIEIRIPSQDAEYLELTSYELDKMIEELM